MTHDASRTVDRRQLADASSTLAGVDELLAGLCDGLAAEWGRRSPEPVDVLRADLPLMLRARLVPGAGKRLRPVMCHWGWVAASGAVDGRGHDALLRTGAALELLHLFALVHDDVVDRSDSRRGRPAAHVEAGAAHAAAGALGDPAVFGDGIAVLLGDLALSEASALIADTPPPVRQLWRAMLRELVHGQLLDLTAAAARRRDLDLARRIARLKSGAYSIQRPLLLGAALAAPDPAVTAALAGYGEHLGEAFALRDDLLGIWGDPAVTGKPVGDDLLSGKATVVLAAARRLLPPAQSERYLGSRAVITEADVPRLQRLLDGCGVRDDVERRITDEAASALGALDGVGLDPDGVAGLTRMVHVIAWRDA
ncbi:MAG TPA: polyprenyl synthetase family protein [Intrasporangium sp.]|uniref:polyprenyl synthetase family protein n=1 Tax=Intrasporangium sp. TaxID=1925024 RepID=UPI002D789860|nr:polyprenyl synthetase family protein [Intrasporangium sp.]HET7398655.1 polyprenyl synthetase family protein [Intrasporangium sp.]